MKTIKTLTTADLVKALTRAGYTDNYLLASAFVRMGVDRFAGAIYMVAYDGDEGLTSSLIYVTGDESDGFKAEW